MSMESEIARISGAKTAIKAAIEAKGVSVPASTKIDGMAAKIAQIYAVPTVEELMAAKAAVAVAFVYDSQLSEDEDFIRMTESETRLSIYEDAGDAEDEIEARDAQDNALFAFAPVYIEF